MYTSMQFSYNYAYYVVLLLGSQAGHSLPYICCVEITAHPSECLRNSCILHTFLPHKYNNGWQTLDFV